MDGTLAFARWVYFLSVMVLFGSALFPFYALDRTMAPAPAHLPRNVNPALALAAVTSAAIWLLCFTAGLSGREGMVETLRGVLMESDFGTVWFVRISLVLLLLVISFSGRPELMVGPAFLLLTCEGWQGHAAAWGFVGSLTQALHVAGAGAWIGGLLPLGRLIAAAQRRPSEVAGAETALWRFSRFGMVAVALIVVTGAMNTWRMLGGFPDPSNSYGRALLLKISLFVAMLGLAVYNRYVLVSRMKSAPAKGLRTLSRSVALEQIIGFGVLLDVSALGLMDPYA
ncbi:copper homeostasis membrane protein CopD [Mesorhizobium sp. LMG 17147]|uniref:copper homeostasis membrane protein CopD n=1 Tax=Mesorhizobium sp. LMG 17147 TaxID=2963091 RepID=UPI0020C9F22F|nr:copper homeostasis membrane protein CopD [Mesorhizobium sp. LMG 17147]